MKTYQKLLITSAVTALLVGCGGGNTLPQNAESAAKPAFNTAGDPSFLKGDAEIAIASFRVVFITEGQKMQAAADKGRWGSSGKASSTATVKTKLTGVDGALMQQITDQAYANFSQNLVEQGFSVLPLQQVTNNPEFKKLDKRDNGQADSALSSAKEMMMGKKSSLNEYPVYSPTGLPLLGESFLCKQLEPLFKSICLPKVASALGMTTLHVAYVVDFSSFESSARAGKSYTTNSVYANAKVSTGQNLHLKPQNTGIVAINNKGKEVALYLNQDNPYQGERAFGESVEATSTTDKAVSGFKNALGALSAVSGGTARSDSTVTYEMQAQPEIYQAMVNDLLKASSNELAWSLEYFRNKP